MKRVITILSAALLFFSSSQAQITFEKTYGTSIKEEGKTVRQTLDGGYILGGTNLIKTTDSGIVEWTKPIYSDYVNTTADSGFILMYSGSNIKFTKVDKVGNVLWDTYFTQGVWAREANSIEQTNDGGYIVAGRFQSVTGSGMMLLKLNANGGTSWKQTYWEASSAAFAYGMEAHQTADGGYIIGGYTHINHYDSTRHKDVYLVKTDSIGNAQWQKNIGGTAEEYAYSIQEIIGGGYIVAGSQYDSVASAKNMYLLKLNALGDTIWTRTYGGTHSSEFNSVDVTSDYGYIVTGHSNISTSGGTFDIEVLKIDSSGNTLWTKTFGGTADENGNSIQQTTDGGYIITGFTESMGAGAEDVYLLKLDANGEIIIATSIDETDLKSKVIIYPNPSNGLLYLESEIDNISIRIFSMEGKEVFSQALKKGTNSLAVSNFAKGVYLYQLSSQSVVSQQGKLMLK